MQLKIDCIWPQAKNVKHLLTQSLIFAGWNMLNCTAGEKTVNIYCQLLSEKSLCFYRCIENYEFGCFMHPNSHTLVWIRMFFKVKWSVLTEKCTCARGHKKQFHFEIWQICQVVPCSSLSTAGVPPRSSKYQNSDSINSCSPQHG